MKTRNNLLKTKTGIIILISFLTLLFTAKVNSQVSAQWVKAYTNEGYGEDDMNDMVVDNAGNVYVTGGSSGTGTSFDFATIKYNSAGVQQWVSRYNGPLNGVDVANAVTYDNSGNVYVTGTSDNLNISGKDICTIKYNSAGVEQWMKRYTSTGAVIDEGYDIAVDNSGNVYVTGSVTNAAGNADIITIRYSSAGVQQWTAQYNSGVKSETGFNIKTDASGNVYSAGNEDGDCLLIKYNPAGTQQWLKTYHNASNGSTLIKNMEFDSGNNICIAGQVSVGPNNYDYLVIKYNNAGTQQWVQTYNGTGNGNDFINSLSIDANNNIYVTGSSIGSGNSDKDYLTIKYNSAGTPQWTKRYNNPDNLIDEAFGVISDADGNVYVTGKSKSIGSNEDFLTLKYEQSGAEQWLMRFDGSVNGIDFGKKIALDNSGNVIVSGLCHIVGANDYCTIKYTAVTGLQISNGEIPKNFNLSQNYPNPFNPTTNISFSLPKSGITKITVYDMLGREVSVLVNEYLQAGSYNVNFNASGLSSGTYFYKMEAQDFNEIKKMVLVK